LKDALGALIKLLGVLLGLMVVGSLAIVGLFNWSLANAEGAHARCRMSVIEKKIDAEKVEEYSRLCMGSEGYYQVDSCFVENINMPSCFVPRWMFWINTYRG
jgi:hypothetical protein